VSLILQGEGIGKSVHGLEDRLIGARLLGWMVRESAGCNWWICGLTHDGKIITWDSTAQAASLDKALDVPRDKVHFATQALSALVEVGDDGTWLVAWIDNCKRFYLLWKDEDGDIQIPIEIDCIGGWLKLREWQPRHFVEHATTAMATWKEIHKRMEYGAGQQIKLAKGDKPTAPGVM
jgi:hypothetical protein